MRIGAKKEDSVLYVGTDGVEWLDAGAEGLRTGRAAAAGMRPSDIAAAARAAFEAACGPGRPDRRPCVLALGAGLARRKVLELPALRRAEVRAVLRRKAAGLLGAPLEDALFAALPQDGGRAAADGGRRWLLVALRRGFAVELHRALRSAGFVVRRAVAVPVAALDGTLETAQEGERGGSDPARIVVGFESAAATVSLLHGRSLVAQHTLEGSLEREPALAASLLQEIKSHDAFWRKTSRGGSVGEVLLFGLSGERGELLAHAVRTALAGAEVRVQGDRSALLAACRGRGALHVDLTVPLPPRRSAVVAAVAGPLLLLAGAGLVAERRSHAALEEIERRVAELVTQTAGSEEVFEKSRSARESIELLRESALHAGAAAETGHALEALLTDALSAFGPDGALLALSVGRLDEGGEVEILGATDPHPWTAARNVARIARSLEASPTFAGIAAEPPAELPAPGEPYRFRLRCEVAR